MKLPLKTIIVEDLPDDFAVLKKKLLAYPDLFSVENLYVAMTFQEAKDVLSVESFDLSILDIQLDEHDCYRLIEEVGIGKFGIITLNTISRNVPGDKTEKIGSFLWLPKPYSTGGMEKFVLKLRDRINENKTKDELLDQMTNLTKHLTEIKAKIDAKGGEERNNYEIKFLRVTEGKKRIDIPYDKILFIQSDRNKQMIVCQSTQGSFNFVEINKTLSEIYRRLDTNLFCQTQKSYIVNLSKIVGCDPIAHTLVFGVDSNFPEARYSPENDLIVSFLRKKGWLD